MATVSISKVADRQPAIPKAVAAPAAREEFNSDYLLRLRARDAATWRHFDDFFRPRIRAKFRAKFQWEIAEDLTAATMLAVVESIDRGEPQDPSCLAGYVFSICHNKMSAAWRTNSKENTVDFDFESLRGKDRTPLEKWLSIEEAKKVEGVLAKLSPRDRDILVCIFYHGQDRDEVCRRYGVERDQLKMILFHARKRFQREWERKS